MRRRDETCVRPETRRRPGLKMDEERRGGEAGEDRSRAKKRRVVAEETTFEEANATPEREPCRASTASASSRVRE